jgi:hypothetical protein
MASNLFIEANIAVISGRFSKYIPSFGKESEDMVQRNGSSKESPFVPGY